MTWTRTKASSCHGALKPPPSWKAAASPARTCIEAVPISLADGPTVLRSIIAMAEGLFDTSRCLSISIKYLLKEAGIIAVLWRPRAYGRVGALFPPRLRYVPKLRHLARSPQVTSKDSTPSLFLFLFLSLCGRSLPHRGRAHRRSAPGCPQAWTRPCSFRGHRVTAQMMITMGSCEDEDGKTYQKRENCRRKRSPWW